MHAAMSKSNITAYVNNSFIFFKSAYVLFLFSTDWFCRFFARVSLSYVDLLPSLVLWVKPVLLKRNLHELYDDVTF